MCVRVRTCVPRWRLAGQSEQQRRRWTMALGLSPVFFCGLEKNHYPSNMALVTQGRGCGCSVSMPLQTRSPCYAPHIKANES